MLDKDYEAQKQKRIDDLTDLKNWQTEMGTDPPNETALSNARAISTALSVFGIKHFIYPKIVDAGIQFEFNDYEVEIDCLNTGRIETHRFDDEANDDTQ